MQGAADGAGIDEEEAMPDPSDLRSRQACPEGTHAIAGLHADSWQRHYRGAYSDDFLDRDAASYLLPVWIERMGTPNPDRYVWPDGSKML
jgi:hypothetical protein